MAAHPLKRQAHRPSLTGHVVSHTHWDRAWYWTFEETRVRLLDLLDDLLELMSRRADYRYFTLDGQLAMIVDYLALRPERVPVVRQLAGAGRLLLGPFFVLPDLFIPTGESLVRNLRAGHELARALGPVMKLGYLPDPFGHPAQLPQILQGFGIDGVLFTRGMGDEGEALGADFLWEAPDGSRVLATHQMGGGYGNAMALGRPAGGASAPSGPTPEPEQVKRAFATVEQLVRQLAPLCPHGQLLLNNGCDHLPAQPELPALLRAVQRRCKGVRLVHSTPMAYQRAVRRAMRRGHFRPQRYQGELRGSRYHNLLAGVLSARVDLKLRHHACETLLLRYAEPLAAIAAALGLGRDDRSLLAHAWRMLLLCQPHDDICGCSIDRVHEDDLVRMAQVAEVAGAVRDRACAALAAEVRAAGPLVFNPHPWPVESVLRLDDDGAPAAPALVQREPGYHLVTARLPALGYAALDAVAASPRRPVLVREGRTLVLENAFVEVRLDRCGLFTVTHRPSGSFLARVGELWDEGDAGDTYDFSPPLQQQLVRSARNRARLRLLERGPLRAVVEIVTSLRLPQGLTEDRRARCRERRECPVRVLVQLCADSSLVACELSFDNQVDDHRLRWGLEVPGASTTLLAGAPFQVIERALRPPATVGWHQPPAATQPFSDLVVLQNPSSGVALFAPGLHEIEAQIAAQPAGHEEPRTRLLVTLLRSVRWLSRDDLLNRRGEAGPCWPVQGARQRGASSFRLGVLPFLGSWLAAEVPRRGAEFAAPPTLFSQQSGVGERLPAALEMLRLEPASVQLSALEPGPQGSLVARLVNLESRPVEARLEGPYRAKRLRLDGSELPDAVDLERVPLGPHQIVALRLMVTRQRP